MITEQEIRDIIKDVSGKDYIGKLRVVLDDGWYSVLLYMDQYERPRIEISMETIDDSEFKEYFGSEMKTRKMDMVQFWTLKRVDPPAKKDNCEQRKRNS